MPNPRQGKDFRISAARRINWDTGLKSVVSVATTGDAIWIIVPPDSAMDTYPDHGTDRSPTN
jgi:hypothetical protein